MCTLGWEPLFYRIGSWFSHSILAFRNEWSRLSETVLRLLSYKKALISSDKIRLVALLALASDGLDDMTLDNLVKAAGFNASEK